MREDMFKVIVERPRGGRSRAKPEAPWRLKDAEDGGPACGPLRPPRHRSKWLSENLSPLYRFLDKSVGRPWNKVHAEVCEHLSAGNVVQQHVVQHLYDRVAVHTELRDGEVWVRGWRERPLKSLRTPLYVHPVCGILLENRAHTHHKRLRRQREESRNARVMQQVRYLAPGIRLERINEAWFELRFAIPQTHEEARAGPVLIGKRQLGKKELRKYGL